MVHEERLIATLRDSGRRLTRQRQLVLDVLKESREHLDAEAVCERARARDPNISLATVYRTLALLGEMGLVEQHQLGEDHAHFEAVQDTPHYHFTCARCSCVVEFDAPQVEQVVADLSRRYGLQVSEVHLFLSGYCKKCQETGDLNCDGS